MKLKPALAVIAYYTVHLEDASAFSDICRSLAQAARTSAGCVFFQVSRDLESSDRFQLSEGWVDQAAVDAFGQSEPFRALLSRAMKLRLQGREGTRFEVRNSEPIAMPG